MFDVVLVLVGLFAFGFATGYGARALVSRRRRYRRVVLPTQVKLRPAKKNE